MIKPLLTVIVLLLFLPSAAGAQDLYTGIAVVEGQSEEERRAAAPDALIHVLQKLTGKTELPNDPILDGALADASNLMVAYQYQEAQRILPDGEVLEELLLLGSFNPDSVDQLVRDLALPRWRPERSPIVIWVVLDEGRGRVFQPVEYQYAWDSMEDIAQFRGLPVAWPGLSPELAEQVDLQLLWGGYTDQLLASGANSDGVTIVAARREGPSWNVRWTFADERTSSSWRTRSTDLSLALTDGVNELANLVASINSIEASALGDWNSELLISGMLSSSDYVKTLNYLSGLSLVESVDVLNAGPDGVRFGLELNAEPRYLQESIASDGLLEPSEVPFEYQLIRKGGTP